MKALIIFALQLVILSSVHGELASSAAKPIPHEVLGGYFASNKFESDAATSFVALSDQQSFDKVFGVAMVMGDRSKRLAADAFKTEMVVAAIHRGKAMTTYQVSSVTMDAQTLVVTYTTRKNDQGGASFACPLMVSVKKDGINTVKFVENGKTVRTLEVKASVAQPTKPQK